MKFMNFMTTWATSWAYIKCDGNDNDTNDKDDRKRKKKCDKRIALLHFIIKMLKLHVFFPVGLCENVYLFWSVFVVVVGAKHQTILIIF